MLSEYADGKYFKHMTHKCTFDEYGLCFECDEQQESTIIPFPQTLTIRCVEENLYALGQRFDFDGFTWEVVNIFGRDVNCRAVAVI